MLGKCVVFEETLSSPQFEEKSASVFFTMENTWKTPKGNWLTMVWKMDGALLFMPGWNQLEMRSSHFKYATITRSREWFVTETSTTSTTTTTTVRVEQKFIVQGTTTNTSSEGCVTALILYQFTDKRSCFDFFFVFFLFFLFLLKRKSSTDRDRLEGNELFLF